MCGVQVTQVVRALSWRIKPVLEGSPSSKFWSGLQHFPFLFTQCGFRLCIVCYYNIIDDSLGTGKKDVDIPALLPHGKILMLPVKQPLGPPRIMYSTEESCTQDF